MAAQTRVASTQLASKQLPKLVHYTQPLAFNPQKTMVMLAEKRLPHETVKVDLFGGGALQPEFMRISPSASVPVLKQDGKVILESKVIAELLDNIDGQPLGGDQVDRAFVKQFLEEIDAFDGNVYAFSRTPQALKGAIRGADDFRKKFAAQRAKENPGLKETYDNKIKNMSVLLDKSEDPQQVRENDAKLDKLMDKAESRLSPPYQTAGQELYLAGPAYSIVDALFAPILYRVNQLGQYKKVIAPRPAVERYMKRMQSRPSWKEAFGAADNPLFGAKTITPAVAKIMFSKITGRY